MNFGILCTCPNLQCNLSSKCYRLLLRPTSPFCMSIDFCSFLLIEGRLIASAVHPGPNHDLLHINVINRTALLGKIDAITALGKGIHCISESSVTNKAQFWFARIVVVCVSMFHTYMALCMMFPSEVHTLGVLLSYHHVFHAFNDIDPI